MLFNFLKELYLNKKITKAKINKIIKKNYKVLYKNTLIKIG